ncbi:hypothetical protein [Actinomycetospora lemnae]|uniref:Uncharacterized protein n=1 Tax=Actinomycetospora lemnae TaxID=3019891 RepID=A0ABT5SVQ5_9PSEU|nr:hypothetical protein [Actinomycetospora sp. DW7H6]MDD7965808.1 hypothetical protein [Actinomycetospora sp. DW7H6]
MTPPPPVQWSFRLWVAAVVVGVLGSAFSLATAATVPSGFAAGSGIAGAVIGLLFLAALVYLALRMRQGDHWARLVLAVLGGVSAVFTVVGVLLTAGLGVSLGWVSTVLSLVQAALIVAAILCSYQATANAYFR